MSSLIYVLCVIGVIVCGFIALTIVCSLFLVIYLMYKRFCKQVITCSEYKDIQRQLDSAFSEVNNVSRDYEILRKKVEKQQKQYIPTAKYSRYH